MGGSGQGPYALTTYLARWLPDRIVNRGVTDIELRFLAPNHLKTLEFDDDGTIVVATTHQAGSARRCSDTSAWTEFARRTR